MDTFQLDVKSPFFCIYWCCINILSFFLAGQFIVIVKDKFNVVDTTYLISLFSIIVVFLNMAVIFKYMNFNQRIIWLLSDFLSYSALLHALPILSILIRLIKDSSQNINSATFLLQNSLFWLIVIPFFLIWMASSYLQIASKIFKRRQKMWAIYNSCSFLSILLFLASTLEMVETNPPLFLLSLLFSIVLKSLIAYFGFRYCCFYKN